MTDLQKRAAEIAALPKEYHDHWHIKMADLIAVQAAEIERLRKDAERLNWVEDREAVVSSHREPIIDDEYGIWWQVGKGRKSLSGHPLGSVRDAIDAAMKKESE